jgi:protein-S-isoprenylcysteine O-methyltransferase Ste14
MNEEELKKLKRKIIFMFPLAFAVIAGILFIPAGSFAYWQGWVFCAVILSLAFFVTIYFLDKSPEFLERRMMFKEKEMRQKKIIKIGDFIFLLMFLIPGLDYRFHWSAVPVWLVLASDVMIILSYYLVFLTFKENPFAARTVEVFEDHKLVDTGLYAVVRHPMYTGVSLMFLFIPTALGSFWALTMFIPVVAIIVLRTLNEEEVLKRDLPGYAAYCEKVRYRLVPYIW